jgi:hypothetical protein
VRDRAEGRTCATLAGVARPLYVETRVRSDPDSLWRATQEATSHARWDLRFSRIVDVIPQDGSAPRAFRYELRLPGRTHRGHGHQHRRAAPPGRQRHVGARSRSRCCCPGTGEVHEWYDEQAGRHRIEVVVSNRVVGRLFGYRGSFTATARAIPPEGVPPSVKPKREERRE